MIQFMSHSKQILFVRHAESHANVGLKTSNPAKIELTENGFHQARQLADSIQDAPDLIVTSPFVRTYQTAAPLLEKFPHVEHQQWPIHEFTYLSPLRCHLTTMEQRIPLATAYWDRCDPQYRDGDGAESFSDFIRRTQQTLARLSQRPEGRILLFSHMLFISALNWLQTRPLSANQINQDMQAFRQYLFQNSIQNCQIVPLVI